MTKKIVHAVFASDEEQRSYKISGYLEEILAEKHPNYLLKVFHATSSDPYENLEKIRVKLAQPESSNTCVLALDVKYPHRDQTYAGIEIVHDGLEKQRSRVQHVVWYSVHLAEEGEAKDKVIAMAKQRAVKNITYSGAGQDLLAVAEFIYRLIKKCIESDTAP